MSFRILLALVLTLGAPCGALAIGRGKYCGRLYVQIEGRRQGIHLDEGVRLPPDVIRNIILALDAYWQRIEISGHLRRMGRMTPGASSLDVPSVSGQIFLNSFVNSIPPEEESLMEIERKYQVQINRQTGEVSRER